MIHAGYELTAARRQATLRVTLICLLLLVSASMARADSKADCNQEVNDDLAIRGCSELIGRNPRDAVAYYNRGTAYLNKGQVDGAIADLNKAIELNPRDAEAHNNRGNAYMRKSQYQQATANYERAIALKPAYDKAHNNMGEAYENQNMLDRALEYYN